MICGAGRSIGCRSCEITRPFPSSGRPSGSIDAPEQTVADRNINNSPRASHFRARAQMRAVAQQYNADFFFIEIEGEARKFPGNSINSSKPTLGSPETLAMPMETVVIVPTSRADKSGLNSLRARLDPARASFNVPNNPLAGRIHCLAGF